MQWLLDKIAPDQILSPDEALAVLNAQPEHMPLLLHAASEVRRRYFGNAVILCSILNARCGECSEDCAFCAQSAHHQTGIEAFPMISREQIASAAREAVQANRISHFGVVTSGGSLDDRDVRTVCAAVPTVEQCGVIPCASLGMLDESQLRGLKQAGLVRYHHNLETAESFFPSICSTHTFADRLVTLRRARAAGLEVCSGGIFGMGETPEQRVELAMTLRDEAVQSIPLNFLMPIPGTPLEGSPPMKPLDILKTVAMFRLVCRSPEIKVCAGREDLLRDLQSMFFYAGATGMMVGDYLTRAGRPLHRDLQLLRDLEVDFGP
ncbi:MAG: biotin synthase BioB [Armatimonadota bacterium]|nr:biotin synthase BioB [Armatimonadota bacterium]